MKIRIIDLMDHYYGDTGKLDAPRTAAVGAEVHQQRAHRRTHRALLVAAALLLVVTGGVAMRLGLGRSPEGGNALDEGSAFSQSVQETLSPELPAAVGSTHEEANNVVETPSELQAPQVMEAVWDYKENMYMNGNLFYLNGGYYTTTENGPEPIELQNLHTTVEFHGTWEVDIDYAVIDGELIFHNNTDRNDYTIVDGERMSWADYVDWKMEQIGETEGTSSVSPHQVDLSEVEWITPQVAIAEPLKGSADTVQLSVRRTDLSYIDNLTYPFFYNIFTGEITDPLANVPELTSRGSLGSVQFNSSLTRALVDIWGEPVYSDGSSGNRTYVCDLVTGEMTWIVDLMKPFLPEDATYEQFDPEVGLEGSLWSECGSPVWADDDTLVLEMLEGIQLEVEGSVEDYGPDEEVPEEIWDPWERHIWLFAYDMVEGAVRYQLPGVGCTAIEEYNQPYLSEFVYDDEGGFIVMDTAAGKVYSLPEADTLGGNWWSESENRTVMYGENGKMYLVDNLRLGWVDLLQHIQPPEEEITNVVLLGDDWLCLTTGERTYFYRIADDIPMTPLVEK